MAANTDIRMRNMIMYQIFVRNFSHEGTFRAVIPELDRIRALGTDIIWFTPIHPLGVASRKGSLGSPYANRDYRAVNPEFGTLDGFRLLVDEIHKRGMKCIIDVVYNHTSPDSVLAKEHPEWFYHRADGSFGNRVGDWTDIIDLDYSHRELWDYQIDTLKMWAEIVDGFRCDVASLIPLEFWKAARLAVEEVRPGALWLCESVEPMFIRYMRGQGLTALSDSELYQAFDICYDYDIFDDFKAYIEASSSLARYTDAVNRQEIIYPDNYVKLRFLENHDKPRAASYLTNPAALRNATAFLFFQKGMTLLYAGQEYGIKHLPSLFDRDVVPWNSPDITNLSAFISILARIKKELIPADSSYTVYAVSEDILVAEYTARAGESSAAICKPSDNTYKDITTHIPGYRIIGVFSFTGIPDKINMRSCQEQNALPLADGIYTDLISENDISVSDGLLDFSGDPIIIMSDPGNTR